MCIYSSILLYKIKIWKYEKKKIITYFWEIFIYNSHSLRWYHNQERKREVEREREKERERLCIKKIDKYDNNKCHIDL